MRGPNDVEDGEVSAAKGVRYMFWKGDDVLGLITKPTLGIECRKEKNRKQVQVLNIKNEEKEKEIGRQNRGHLKQTTFLPIDPVSAVSKKAKPDNQL